MKNFTVASGIVRRVTVAVISQPVPCGRDDGVPHGWIAERASSLLLQFFNIRIFKRRICNARGRRRMVIVQFA